MSKGNAFGRLHTAYRVFGWRAGKVLFPFGEK